VRGELQAPAALPPGTHWIGGWVDLSNEFSNVSAEHTASGFRIQVSTEIRRLYGEEEKWRERKDAGLQKDAGFQKDESKLQALNDSISGDKNTVTDSTVVLYSNCAA
jgi:hypothetical protein